MSFSLNAGDQLVVTLVFRGDRMHLAGKESRLSEQWVIDSPRARSYILAEKRSQDYEDGSFVGDDKVNEGEKNRRDVRLFIAH